MLSSYPQLSPVGWGLSRNIRGLGRRFDQRKTLGLDELRQTHLRSHPVRKSDPLAACLSCGFLSCCLIGTVLDQQAELHGSGWSTSEVLGALAEASAFFCREITDLHGAAAETSAGGLAEQLHALVLGKRTLRSGRNPSGPSPASAP